MNDEEIQDELIDKAKEMYGTTENCMVAGYILPNGDLLDFSDEDSNKTNLRGLDHDAIESILYDRKSRPNYFFPENIEKCKFSMGTGRPIDAFLNRTGSIRMHLEEGYMVLQKHAKNRLTRKQLETIEYCICSHNPDEVNFAEYRCGKDGWDEAWIEQDLENDCMSRADDIKKFDILVKNDKANWRTAKGGLW